ncbi:MAG: tetratricopeptide repeat protein [Candidatus Cloacimonetes bacterium]|jgi:class 3 adenylate cyclase/predicted ATPase|nr:tetratricopeptide repeat protein [Candidatus Cloacimonadota bacterium]
MEDTLFFGPDFLSEDAEEQKKSLKEGELREVAVLFADIKGFTNISNLFEPEVIHGKMDEIMKIFSRCITFYGGFVDKYMGDGIMALFGAKKASEQDTQRCVLAAIKMQEQLRLYNKLLNREAGFESVELGLRIGINTGMVSVGKVGQSREGDFTVYGPQVNLASRMESNAPVNRIMMPKRTMLMVENIFEFESHGPVEVKGMDEAIDCWLVLGQKSESFKSTTTEFIGREEEMMILETAFQESQKGIRIVGLKGDAGIGKSRLLDEFCARKQDTLILKGYCSPISPSPFNLFTRMFENYFQIKHNIAALQKKELLTSGLKDLATNAENPADILDCLPLIALLMEIRIPDPRIEQKGKDLLNHILQAIEILMLAMINQARAQGKRIIIIMDDIHLIDDASAQAVDFILDRFHIDEPPILILALYRLDYSILKSITGHPSFSEMELKAFDREKITQLLVTYAGSKKLSDETLQLVIDLSAGNPFYLEEWCNYIGNLPKTDMDEYPVPGNLHALILSRLDNLPPNMRLILHKAAVIGNEFFVEILREVESMLRDSVNVESTLGQLEEHSLIMKLLGFDFSTYFFKHITTREVAYQTLLHQNRKMLHELTATAIENVFSSNLDDFVFTLADHYVKAEIPPKAIPYLKQGIDKAAKVYDNSLALKLGCQLLEYSEDDQEKCELMVRMADILWMTGKWADATEYIESATKLAVPQSSLMCEIYRFNGIAAFYSGDFDTALKQFQAGYEVATQIDDKLQICVAQSNLGIWYQHHENYPEALDYHFRSLELAREMGEIQREAKTHSNLGLIFLEQGEGDKAYTAFENSLKLSRESMFLKDESIALGNLGWTCLNMDRLDEASDWLNQKLDLATKMNDKLEIIQALGNLGNVYYEMHDYASALSFYERSLALKEQLGNKQEIERSRKAVEICKQKIAGQV